MLILKVIPIDVNTYDIQLINNDQVVWSWKICTIFLEQDVAEVIVKSKFLTEIPVCG